MIDTILNSLLRNTFKRVTLAMYVAGIPLMIAVCYLGASYQQSVWGLSFVEIFVKLIVAYFSIGTLGGWALLYPFERFYVQKRVNRQDQSRQRIVARFFAAIVTGIILGVIVRFVMHLGGLTYDPIIESSYLIISLTTALSTVATYTLLEAALEEVRQRETALKQTISELHIQIDDMKRRQEVSAIVDNESFADLKTRAEALKARHTAKAQGS